MRIAITLMTLAFTGCFGELTDVDPTGPDARVVDVKAVFSQWSGCMTMTNFQSANMAGAWNEVTSTTGKQCVNCHDSGQFGFLATPDENAFFTGLSQHSSLMVKYFKVDYETEKVLVNADSFANANKIPDHPKFDLANVGMAALEAFHAATAANPACDATRMVD